MSKQENIETLCTGVSEWVKKTPDALKKITVLIVYLVFLFLQSAVTLQLFNGFNLSSGVSVFSSYEFHHQYVISWILITTSFFFFSRSDLRKKSDIDKFLASASLQQFVIAFIAVVGLIVSIMASEIQNIILQWVNNPPEAQWFPVSINFWFTSFVLFAVLLLISNGKHSAAAQKAQKKYQHEQNQSLREAIQLSLPPYFAKSLADSIDIAEDIVNEHAVKFNGFTKLLKPQDKAYPDHVFEDAEKLIKEQQESLRAILILVARLARYYDNVSPDDYGETTYRANLMLLVDDNSAELLEYFNKNLKALPSYGIPFDAKAAYHLFIDKNLSIKLPNDDNRQLSVDEKGKILLDNLPDEDVINRELFIYEHPVDGDISFDYNMIGAPAALVSGSPQFIPDTLEAVEKATHLPEHLRYSAEVYFKAEKKGQSVVSMPVAASHHSRSVQPKKIGAEYYGALNIYRNSSNIFSGKQSHFKFFADFIRPINILFARLIPLHLSTIYLVQRTEKAREKTNPLPPEDSKN